MTKNKIKKDNYLRQLLNLVLSIVWSLVPNRYVMIAAAHFPRSRALCQKNSSSTRLRVEREVLAFMMPAGTASQTPTINHQHTQLSFYLH